MRNKEETKLEQLYKELKGLKPIPSPIERELDTQFRLEFNYNSNHIEGNTLTYDQTQLLLIFDKITGNAKMRDLEEMKAHNVGLEMMKQYAADKERPLTTSFIRELNGIILKQNFWKNAITPDGQPARMEVKVGEYKTRPNSVMTQAGTIFEYALPEETPMLMNDLVVWYNHEYQKGKLSPIELATLLHYRYIRIHPFEDGNGRIARLLVNYVLLKHDYPMIVIQTSDRENYINTLNQCDIAAGRAPSDGARATIEHVRPFTDYMTEVLATAMENQIKFIKSNTICKNAVPSAALQSAINRTQSVQDNEPQAITNKNRLKL